MHIHPLLTCPTNSLMHVYIMHSLSYCHVHPCLFCFFIWCIVSLVTCTPMPRLWVSLCILIPLLACLPMSFLPFCIMYIHSPTNMYTHVSSAFLYYALFSFVSWPCYVYCLPIWCKFMSTVTCTIMSAVYSYIFYIHSVIKLYTHVSAIFIYHVN